MNVFVIEVRDERDFSVEHIAEDITGDYFTICAKINNTDIHLARVNTEEEATNFLKRLYKTLGGGVDVRDYQPTGD